MIQTLNELDANVLSQNTPLSKVCPRPTHALMERTLALLSFVCDSVDFGRTTLLQVIACVLQLQFPACLHQGNTRFRNPSPRPHPSLTDLPTSDRKAFIPSNIESSEAC